MEKAVDRQGIKVLRDGASVPRRFSRSDRRAQNNFTPDALGRQWKGQDVGGGAPAAVLSIQPSRGSPVHEGDGQLVGGTVQPTQRAPKRPPDPISRASPPRGRDDRDRHQVPLAGVVIEPDAAAIKPKFWINTSNVVR